jgi:prepilin-type N-terminal cleavage/methylation domain-containing protein
MRRDRGYTLLELGIAMAVILILLAAVATTSSGAFRSARAERTGAELDALTRVAANALKRNLVVQPSPGVGLPPTYLFRFDGVTSLALDNAAPLCFDLSQFPGSTRQCPPGSGRVGPTWSGGFAVRQTPAGSPIVALLGGRLQNNGFNAWCEPYVACFYPHRVEVFTCVPTDDRTSGGLVGTSPCGDCTSPSPVTDEPTSCVFASVPAFSQTLARLRVSYSEPLLLDIPYFLPANYTP